MFNKYRRYSLNHYLAGALPARVGDEMSDQVLLLVALAVTGSIRVGSSIVAGLTLSAALGGPLLGAFLDRSEHPGRILAGALAMYATGLVAITLVIGHAPGWLAVSIALIVGFFMPAISGGWSSRLRSFIAEGEMARASAIDATTFNMAGLIGPGIAGLAAAWLGAYWAVAILICLLLISLPMAWRLPRRKGRSQTHSFTYDMANGFKVIITNKILLRITLVSVISYAGIGMLWIIYPLIGRELFGKAGYGGTFASILSASALLATIAYAKWPTKYSPDTVTFATTLVLAIAIGVLLMAHTLWVAAFAMVIAGLADGPQLAAIFAVRHREAPAELRSQVFTTGASLKITAAAVGAEVAGLLADNSLRITILTAGAIQGMAAIVFIISKVENK